MTRVDLSKESKVSGSFSHPKSPFVRGGLDVRPFIPSQDLVREALQTIQRVLLYVFMLAVMYVS